MRSDDLKVVAQMSRALWADPRVADPQTAETVSAVNLLHLTEERALERAARALLDQASKTAMASHTIQALQMGTGRIENPFYRLFPEERFLLIALHSGRWSYARLSRILECSVEEVESTAWGIRIKLAQKNPLGSELRSPHCPEYDPYRPWTQRFLDEEVHAGRQRFILQNHLMVCSTCQRALSCCRDIFYAVDQLLPRMEQSGADRQVILALEALSQKSQGIKRPSERTFLESLGIFFRRPDIQWTLIFLFIFLLFFRR